MKKIIQALKKTPQKHALIIGDVMLDEYVFGSASRISPEAPVPIIKQERMEWRLGGAANVAANCKHLGFDVSVVSIINDHDHAGKKICSLFHDIHLDSTSLLYMDSRQTTCKKRFLSGAHQCLRVDQESDSPLNYDERNALKQRIDAYMRSDSIILLSDYAKGIIDQDIVAYVVNKARAKKCLVIADPKGPNFSKYKGVNYLKPNIAAYNQMINFFGLSHENALFSNAQRICSLLELNGLIVTMGEKGIRFISQSQDILSPSFKREVYDVSGAGDTAFAFIALALANNISMSDSLRLANMASSIAVSHMTTYAVSLEELIDKELDMSEKIFYNWARLKIELDWLRAEGKRVVFTNGCFDLLHSGHIHTLVEAKKLGDILIVALNSDDSIKRQGKGAGRPINDLFERALIMSSIGVVDFVTSFPQDKPQAIIEYLQPDVLVKGGDYKKEEVVGYDFVSSYGGDVKIIDYIPGKSTTGIISSVKSTEKYIRPEPIKKSTSSV
ncbi:MAG: bifunctional heptose 7-phosphate kinase/heptose 1-phosphate adenyltransferase [bacterium]